MSRIDEARRKWGIVFDALRTACEYSNSAWYHAQDKPGWIQEDEQRLQGVEKVLQSTRNTWKAREGITDEQWRGGRDSTDKAQTPTQEEAATRKEAHH